jgi:hypothetical protein
MPNWVLDGIGDARISSAQCGCLFLMSMVLMSVRHTGGQRDLHGQRASADWDPRKGKMSYMVR